jgi:membrane protein
MALITWKDIVDMIKTIWKEFNEDNAIYYSASLSYFTLFALPSIIIIIIAISGSLVGKETVREEIYEQIENIAGTQSAEQILAIVDEANKSTSGFLAKVIAITTLILSSTGVFTAIQSALNMMWEVKPKPKRDLLKLIADRALSFALIVSISIIILISILMHAGLIALIKLITLTQSTAALIEITNFIIPLGVITLLFAMIFKFLPDARISWKDVWIGAFATALLFTLGKYLMGLYLINSDIGSVYGAAGTIIIILLWIYFSSIILFIGAEFTQVYARKHGKRIEPASYAVRIETKIIESGEK